MAPLVQLRHKGNVGHDEMQILRERRNIFRKKWRGTASIFASLLVLVPQFAMMMILVLLIQLMNTFPPFIAKVKELQEALAAEKKREKQQHKKKVPTCTWGQGLQQQKHGKETVRQRNTTIASKSLFYDALIRALHQHIQQAGNSKERRLISNLVTGKIVKKYRVQKYAQSTLGFTWRRWKSVGGNPCSFSRKKYVSAWKRNSKTM